MFLVISGVSLRRILCCYFTRHDCRSTPPCIHEHLHECKSINTYAVNAHFSCSHHDYVNTYLIRPNGPLPPTHWKNRAGKYLNKSMFNVVTTRFDSLLTSWRPGTCLKSFLEAMRFFSTECEPVATQKTSNCVNVYDLSTLVAPLISPKEAFLEKGDLICVPRPSTRWKTIAKGLSSYD